MYLSQLSLNHFKNYSQSTFRFNPKINVLFGKNGAGKTNVLDAIYYLSITKSYFNSVDHQQILQGEQYFILEALVNRDELSEKLRLIFQRGRLNYSRLCEIEHIFAGHHSMNLSIVKFH